MKQQTIKKIQLGVRLISTFVRLILICVLLYFVYKETGIATTIFAILVIVGLEIQTEINIAQKKVNDITKSIIENVLRKSVNSDINNDEPKINFEQRLDDLKKAKETKQNKQ